MQTPQTIQLLPVVAGLSPETAIVITGAFENFLAEVEQWDAKSKTLVVTDVSQLPEMAEAKKARLALVKVRTTADAKRKELKADSLKYGNAIQGAYNMIEFKIKPIEEYLEKQEKFAEIKAAEEQEQIKINRIIALAPFVDDVNIWPVGLMTQLDFDNLLEGQKQIHANKIEAEKQAELKRIEDAKKEAEKKLAEDKEKLRLEIQNQRLTEFLPILPEGSNINTGALWEMTEEKYQETFKQHKAIYDKKQADKIKAQAAEQKRLSERQELRATELKELGFLHVDGKGGYEFTGVSFLLYNDLFSFTDEQWSKYIIDVNKTIEKAKAEAEFKQIRDAAEVKMKAEKAASDKKIADANTALAKQVEENKKLIAAKEQQKQDAIKKEITQKITGEMVNLEAIADPKERMKAWVNSATLDSMKINGLNQTQVYCTSNIVEKLIGFKKWAHGEIDKL